MHFTGKIGDVIDISGSNFSRISRVLFSNAGSNFSVPNDNLIKARVPEGVAWDYIKIISDDRSATGISSKKFAPEPLIQDYYPTSGIYGDTISITGLAFSGVSAVTFNGLEASHSVQNNYFITATVPSGDTRGDLTVHGQSGLSYTAVNSFSPQVIVTGFSPTSGIPGVSINIYGKYFFDELMYTGNQSGKYLVSYGKNIYSGYVEKISDTHLSGEIPALLVDGGISVARNDSVESGVQYYIKSESDFDVLALGAPVINASATITGFYSSYYGNQPIIFGSRNVGTDKNGKGLSLGLLNSSSTGSFLNGASGLGEITESSYASPGSNFSWFIDGDFSPQSKLTNEVFGEPGEFNFTTDIYCPCTGDEPPNSCGRVGIDCSVSPAFTMGTFTANPETAELDSFQAFSTPTEGALDAGEYWIAVEMNQLAAFGLSASRSISNQKVKILPSIGNREISYGTSLDTFSQTANSTTQVIDGHKYVISYDSLGAAINTGIYGTPGVTKNVVKSMKQSANWKGFGSAGPI